MTPKEKKILKAFKDAGARIETKGRVRLKSQLKRVGKVGVEAILETIHKLNEARISVDYNFAPEVALQHWFLEGVFAIRRPR